MKAKIMIAAAAAIGLWVTGFFVAPAAMAVELDFNLSAPTSGTISYGGGGGALIGSNIEVDNVVGLSTPANANVTSVCFSCLLNFNSGNLDWIGPSERRLVVIRIGRDDQHYRWRPTSGRHRYSIGLHTPDGQLQQCLRAGSGKPSSK